MYVCGITPYDATHMGHANTYVSFDLLNRVWRDAGLDVHYVQNVTDVDDPLLERATATGVDWTELAAQQIQLFREDMTALRVLPPAEYVGAVEAIPQIIDLIAELQQRGAVYAVDDPEFPDLYFAQSSDPEFGSLSQLPEAEAVALFAERGGDPDRPGKKGPLDCLVWRLQRDGEPGWESPFGSGRPGWHIECSAISLGLLGTDFDAQGGGSDLIFPHHEMCASGTRVATDAPFAQVYAHSGMVGLDGEKMSKSKGNLVLVSRLRADGVDPMAIRLALLSQHYRSDWAWTDDLLQSATAQLARRSTPTTSWPGCEPRWPTTSTPPRRWPRSTPGPAPPWTSTATTTRRPRWSRRSATPCSASSSDRGRPFSRAGVSDPADRGINRDRPVSDWYDELIARMCSGVGAIPSRR
jgi:L-cysteine:1D-myo-inositol 2-amino-2-deoxy-alpha-D-glucopyranoside ligase